MKNEAGENLITIKYQTPDGLYDFKSLDESDYLTADDFREDMEDIIESYQSDGCKIIWIREILNYNQLR